MSTLEQAGKRLALAFLNMDDIVFAKEMTGMGMGQIAQAGKSAVGGAMVGGGMAARAALLGAQVATKSARAATGAVKGFFPGGEIAEELVATLQKRVVKSGETASLMATRGVEIGRPDGEPTTDPLLGNVWLDKRMEPGSTWNSALADTIFDLARLATLPLTASADAVGDAMSTSMGRTATRSSWSAFSSLVDGAADEVPGSDAVDRVEQRALLLGLALAPFWQASKDVMDIGEGLSRAALGDGRKLRQAVGQVLERMEMSGDDEESRPGEPWLAKAMRGRAKKAATHTPAHLLKALEDNGNDLISQYVQLGGAVLSDGSKIGALASLYGQLLALISINSFNSMVNGSLDVAEIESWVTADEACRESSGGLEGTPKRCPTALSQLETIVAATSSGNLEARPHGFLTDTTIDLARDTVFAYSVRALGRVRALTRVERIFGPAVRDRLAYDCSLRREILDAGSALDRDRKIYEQVEQLLRRGIDELRTAREAAADRLQSMTPESCDGMLALMLPHRLSERAEVLRRFTGMADSAAALHAVPTQEPERTRVFAEFDSWLEPDVPVTPVRPAVAAQ